MAVDQFTDEFMAGRTDRVCSLLGGTSSLIMSL